MIVKWLIQVYVVWAVLSFSVVGAQPNSSQEQTVRNAFKEAQQVQQVGPAEIQLLDQATLKLPKNYIYIPQPQAGKIMESIGNSDNPSMIGLVLPGSDKENWMTIIEYRNTGYIKDDDANNWDIDKLFTSLKEGTESANKERQKQGFAELEVVGWVEKPQYDANRHHLVWSIAGRHKDAADTDAQVVNYNTYNLGREGYLILTLITRLKAIEGDKPVIAKLLDGTEFVSGKRYEDFSATTDKVAEYGLAALVAGVAAKKLGLLAIAAGFVLKFIKIIAISAFAGGGILMKIFRKKKKEDSSEI